MYCSGLSGSVKLITNGRPAMSMPRAATSVQIITRTAPSRNDYASIGVLIRTSSAKRRESASRMPASTTQLYTPPMAAGALGLRLTPSTHAHFSLVP